MDKSVSVVVYILVAIFGIGSWLAINGLWVELPLLVPRLPEAWDLPSYLVIIIQLANIGPIIFTVANYFRKDGIAETSIVYAIVIVGTAACLLLAFFWDKTGYIGLQEHSVALLVLAFFLALVDCTSSVVFLPYMALFKPAYMTAFYIGEGMSGLIPGVAALIQGSSNTECVNTTVYNVTVINGTTYNHTEHVVYPVTQPPVFSIEVFFFFLFGMMILCGVAFTCLNYLPFCKAEHAKSKTYIEADQEPPNSEGGAGSNDSVISVEMESRKTCRRSESKLSSSSKLMTSKEDTTRIEMPRISMAYLLTINALINALGNGVLPSLQSYATLPYGSDTYHLAVTFSNISNPLACFLSFFVSTKCSKKVSLLTLTGSAVAGFIIYLATQSPYPPLVGQIGGSIIIVSCWIVLTSIFSYTKVTIASIFRDEGRSALIWCGITTQAGSAVGAMITFLLVNHFHLFKSVPLCPS